MAKFNGGVFSKAKGKLAGVVFQQYEGKMYAREYQPNVANPQTEKQMLQRLKFKVSAQFAGLWSPVLALLMWGTSYAREIRSRLMRLLIRAAQIDMGGDTPKAYLEVTEVLDAINTQRYDSNSPSVTLSHPSNVPNAAVTAEADGAMQRIVIAALDANFNVIGERDYLTVLSSDPAPIQLPAVMGTPRFYQVMAINLVPVTNEGNAYLSQSVLDATGRYSADVEYGVAAGDIRPSFVSYDYVELT